MSLSQTNNKIKDIAHFSWRSAQIVENQLDLPANAASWEELSPQQHLRENATHRPHIDGGRVLRHHEEKLGRPIGERGDMLRHVEAMLVH